MAKKISTKTWLLLATGAYYVFFPHSIHMQFSPDWLLGFGFEHIIHQSIGVGLLIWGWMSHKKGK